MSRGPDALCAEPLQLAGDRFRLPRGRSANQCIGDIWIVRALAAESRCGPAALVTSRGSA